VRAPGRQEPDVWFKPGGLLKILSAELALSLNDTAAWGRIEDDAGLATHYLQRQRINRAELSTSGSGFACILTNSSMCLIRRSATG
jgi:hypothetical protein